MPYDLDVDKPIAASARKKPRAGCSVFAWGLFLLVTAFVTFIGYRTATYYRQIKSGGIVDLPQFGDRLSVVAVGRGTIGPATVDRSEVESDTAPSEGPSPSEAKLVIVEFADFQCPYSKEVSITMRTMMRKYGDRVRFEFRDFPIEELHREAPQAALAGRCSAEQGKFWAYHDKLFVNSPLLTDALLLEYADEAGLDRRQFERCLYDRRYQANVDGDLAAAKRLGLQGTPTFFFNGRRVDGAVPSDVFEGIIENMLK